MFLIAINPLSLIQIINEDTDMKTIDTLGHDNGVIAYADDLAIWCKDLETVTKLMTLRLLPKYPA